MAVTKTEPAPTVQTTDETGELTPGWHVFKDGLSLGVYPTEADAEAFADQHPRHAGVEVEVKLV